MFLEWTDPPFAPGHWIPEMIELAGGEPLLRPPARSRGGWPGSRYTRPTRGRDRGAVRLRPRRLQRLADDLVASGVLPAGVPVHAVDANASWARPGTRLPDGVEELAAILGTVPISVVRLSGY